MEPSAAQLLGQDRGKVSWVAAAVPHVRLAGLSQVFAGWTRVTLLLDSPTVVRKDGFHAAFLHSLPALPRYLGLQLPEGWGPQQAVNNQVCDCTHLWPASHASSTIVQLANSAASEQVACRKLRTGSGRQVLQPSQICVVPAHAA